MKLMERTKEIRRGADRAGRSTRRAISGGERGVSRVGTLLVGIAAGAAGALLAFLADPQRGRSRRARLFDQGAATMRRAGRGVERAMRAAGSTAAGRLEAMTEGGSRVGPVDDVTLRDRAETELFRDPSVPKGDININVERGVLVLRGEVPDAATREQLARQAEAIDGVWSVRNLLHLPGEPAEDLVATAG